MNEMKQLEALGLPNVDEILKNKYSFLKIIVHNISLAIHAQASASASA